MRNPFLHAILKLTIFGWFIYDQVQSDGGMRRMRFIAGGGYDPCYSNHAQDYFNRIDVQTALHANARVAVNATVKWQVCK